MLGNLLDSGCAGSTLKVMDQGITRGCHSFGSAEPFAGDTLFGTVPRAATGAVGLDVVEVLGRIPPGSRAAGVADTRCSTQSADRLSSRNGDAFHLENMAYCETPVSIRFRS